jgi:hypothetical protein
MIQGADYYVYVYIDPRNLEEFYYGKGCGSRKDVHIDAAGNSSKAKRIAAIRKAGEKPIIRVIARGLEEEQAYLIEATLLWKLGKFTTNQVAGHFQEKFRPRDTLHRELPGFDFQNRLYYFNVGERPYRKWEDYRKYKFISAGQGVRWRNAILGFHTGDVFAAYLKGHGFVGIGRIKESALRINQVVINSKPLVALCPNMSLNCESAEKSEYVAKVEWIKEVPAEKAKMKWKAGIYTTTHIRASLDRQPETVSYLSEAFGVKFDKILA